MSTSTRCRPSASCSTISPGIATTARYLLDTHDHPVRDEVWALYERAARRFGAVSALVEWDDNIPEFAELAETADRARGYFRRHSS